MSTIRLTITPIVQNVLTELKTYLPLLKDDEIVKLALSELRNKYKPTPKISSSHIDTLFQNIQQNPNGLDIKEKEYEQWWNNQKEKKFS